jgi:hypothetical protein
VSPHEKVQLFAELAKPRLASLLRVRSVHNIYEPTPGRLNSTIVIEGREVVFDKLKRTAQPYRDLDRFTSADRVMQYVIDPGLVPIVTAVSQAIAGRKMIVTRPLTPREGETEVYAYVDSFGLRVSLSFDECTGDTTVAWDCLYGVI